MNFPKDLLYTNDHEWIRVEGDVAYVGITDFAQGELGDIVYIDTLSVGETLDKGEAFGTVEAVKTVSELLMPVAGKILEKNEALDDAAELVNTDPYGKGWMIKIQLTNPTDTAELMDAATYTTQIGK